MRIGFVGGRIVYVNVGTYVGGMLLLFYFLFCCLEIIIEVWCRKVRCCCGRNWISVCLVGVIDSNLSDSL